MAASPETSRGDASSDRASAPANGLAPDFVRGAAAERLRALAHPDRLRIVEVLSSGPAFVGDVATRLRLPIGTVSRHLRVLDSARVVNRSQRGNHVLYVLADRDVQRLAAVAYRGAATQVRRVIALAPDPERRPAGLVEPSSNGTPPGPDE
jgi:DNA-binding transcriptional ArsR family regulator